MSHMTVEFKTNSLLIFHAALSNRIGGAYMDRIFPVCHQTGEQTIVLVLRIHIQQFECLSPK